MLLQKFLSRKKLSRKYRSIFGLKNQSCDPSSVSYQLLTNAGVSPSGFLFFFSFFFKRTCVTLFKLWAVEDYSNLGTPYPRDLIIT